MSSSDEEIALVVGASQGIGLALVENLLSGRDAKFLGENLRVIATARDVESPHLLKLQGQYKDRLVIEVVDLLDDNSIDLFINKINTSYPRLDFFVYNAGIITDIRTKEWGAGDYIRLDKQSYFDAHTVNVIAPQWIFHGLIPLLNKTHELKGGKIDAKVTKFEQITNETLNIQYNKDDETKVRCAFIGSEMGSMSRHRYYALPIYCTSKSSLNHLVRDMALKHPHLGTFVLHPGYTRTRLTANQGDISPEESATGMLTALTREGFASNSSQSIIAWDGRHISW